MKGTFQPNGLGNRNAICDEPEAPTQVFLNKRGGEKKVETGQVLRTLDGCFEIFDYRALPVPLSVGLATVRNKYE